MRGFAIWVTVFTLYLLSAPAVTLETKLDFPDSLKEELVQQDLQNCELSCENSQCIEEKCRPQANFLGNVETIKRKSVKKVSFDLVVVLYFFCCLAGIVTVLFLKVVYDWMRAKENENAKGNLYKLGPNEEKPKECLFGVSELSV